MAAAELQLVGTRARVALDDGNLDGYDRWSRLAGQLVDQMAAGLLQPTIVVAAGRRCSTCGASMVAPIFRAHDDCAVCRAVGGVWWGHE